MIDSASDLVRFHEGRRLYVYDDATGRGVGPGSTLEGHPTIGIGRALDVRGISDDEAEALFAADLADTSTALARERAWVLELDPVRRAVLVDMAFNMGVRGLLGFRRALAALEIGDCETCAVEMLDSRWADQVGRRATRLAATMRSGDWPREG